MKKLQSIAAIALFAGTVAFALVGCASHEPTATAQAATAGAYPLTKCVVSGEDLGDKPYVFTHNGQKVELCCKDCLAKFNEDPDKYMAKIASAK
jgi:hypothetical protein